VASVDGEHSVQKFSKVTADPAFHDRFRGCRIGVVMIWTPSLANMRRTLVVRTREHYAAAGVVG